MAGRLGGILEDFRGDVDRIEHLLCLMKSLKDFAVTRVVDGEENEFRTAALKLHGELVEERTDLPVLSGAVLGYLVGRFEHFARSCVEGVAEDIAEKCSCFDDLPEKLQSTLIQNAGEVMRSPQKYGHDIARIRGIVTDLAEGLGGQTQMSSMPSSIVSVTEGNLRPDVFAELFGRVGVSNLWNEIGKQAAMKVHLELENESDATKGAKSRLNEIIEERNAIVHPTGTGNLPDPDRVIAAGRFLRTLAEVLVQICSVRVVAFNPGSVKD